MLRYWHVIQLLILDLIGMEPSDPQRVLLVGYIPGSFGYSSLVPLLQVYDIKTSN